MRLKKIKRILLFALSLLVLVVSFKEAQSAHSNVEGRGRFKIGFEFQEIWHLCEGAEDMIDIQKKPLFVVKKGDRELWHLVIDTKDIEFVTAPFSNEDEEHQLLSESIQTLIIACEVLSNLRKIIPAGTGITFQQWMEGLPPTPVETTLKATSKKQTLSKAAQERLRNLEKERMGLEKKLEERGCTVEIKESFSHIAGFPFKINHGWVAKFQPQVTIQHPLEKTIPLVINLFGPNTDNPAIQKILPALPMLHRFNPGSSKLTTPDDHKS